MSCTPAESAVFSPPWKTQNSRYSARERSTPLWESGVTSERQRGVNGCAGWLQRERLFVCTMPPAVSACNVRYRTVSLTLPVPLVMIVGSMSCG